MNDSDEAFIEGRVKAYRLARLRLGQAVLPLAGIATIVARRELGVLSVSIAVTLLGVVAYAFGTAPKRYGRKRLAFRGGRLEIDPAGPRLERVNVHRWTLANCIARLYGSEYSYEIRIHSSAEPVLRALLSGMFGAPVALVRRGSRRAIALALCATTLGLITSALAIARDDPRLLVGLPFFFGGAVATGVLSQHVAR